MCKPTLGEGGAPPNFWILGGSATFFVDMLCLWEFSAAPQGLCLLQRRRKFFCFFFENMLLGLCFIMGGNFYHHFETGGGVQWTFEDLNVFIFVWFFFFFSLFGWDRLQHGKFILKNKVVNTLRKSRHTQLPFRVLIFQMWVPCSRGARSFGSDAKCGTVTLLLTQILADTEFCWSAGKYLIKLLLEKDSRGWKGGPVSEELVLPWHCHRQSCITVGLEINPEGSAPCYSSMRHFSISEPQNVPNSWLLTPADWRLTCCASYLHQIPVWAGFCCVW